MGEVVKLGEDSKVTGRGLEGRGGSKADVSPCDRRKAVQVRQEMVTADMNQSSSLGSSVGKE